MKKIKLLLATVISIVLFITGCENMETRDFLKEEITESAEMEEYILAGLDLHHSLKQFEQELKDVDMLSLTPTLDANGNLVISIPGKINIEEKAKDFNRKKRVMLEKHPELKSMKSAKRHDRIKEIVDNSLKITKLLMELESIDNYPRLRSTPIEFTFNNFADESEAFAFLN